MIYNQGYETNYYYFLLETFSKTVIMSYDNESDNTNDNECDNNKHNRH